MSGELRITITGLKEVEHHFEAAMRKFEDLRPVLRRIQRQLYKDFEVIWDKGQEEWTGWSPAYSQWRLSGSLGSGTSSTTTRLDQYAASRGSQSIGEHPFGEMMDLTGRLRESLTVEGDPDNIAIISTKSITFGTDVPYAGHVFKGGDVQGKYGPPKNSSWDYEGGRPPKTRSGVAPFRKPRPLPGFSEGMRRRWRRIVENYSMDALS